LLISATHHIKVYNDVIDAHGMSMMKRNLVRWTPAKPLPRDEMHSFKKRAKLLGAAGIQ
jgi:hypothetical protein